MWICVIGGNRLLEGSLTDYSPSHATMNKLAHLIHFVTIKALFHCSSEVNDRLSEGSRDRAILATCYKLARVTDWGMVGLLIHLARGWSSVAHF